MRTIHFSDSSLRFFQTREADQCGARGSSPMVSNHAWLCANPAGFDALERLEKHLFVDVSVQVPNHNLVSCTRTENKRQYCILNVSSVACVCYTNLLQMNDKQVVCFAQW